MNPYLFLHNKSLNLGKPSRYSRELFYFTSLKKITRENNRSLKTIFFSKKKRVSPSIQTLKFFNNSARKFLVLKLPTMHFHYKLLNSKQIVLPTVKKENFKLNKNKVLKNYKRRILFKRQYLKKRVGAYSYPILLKLKKLKNHFIDTTVSKLTRKKFKGLSQKARILKFKHLKSITKLKKKYPKRSLRMINLRLLFKLRVCKRSKITNKTIKINSNKRYKLQKSGYTSLITLKNKKYKRFNIKPILLNLPNISKVGSALICNRLLSTNFSELPAIIPHVVARYIKPFFESSHFKLDSSPLIYKSVILNSRTSKPLSFRNVGVFLWSQKKHFFKKNTTLRFMFKKKIYSFLFPNEVRKSIMNRRKAFKSYRFVYKTSSFKKKKPYYSLAFFKNNHKDFFRLESLFKSLSSTNLPSNYKLLSNHMTREEILYEDDFANKGHIENLRSKEIFIRRIRFKPGYQRI